MEYEIKQYQRIVKRDKKKDEVAQYVLRWAKKLKALQVKGGKCQRCGQDHFICLIFHHKNHNNKLRTISEFAARRAGWDKISTEINKCELLCENCHREIHAAEVSEQSIMSRRIRSNKKICLLFLQQTKCSMCGYDKCNGALEFHHMDAQEKESGITKYINRHSWKGIEDLQDYVKEELHKCIVVCSNCHKKIHFNMKRFNQYEKQIIEKLNNLPKRNSIDSVKVIKLRKNGLSIKEISEKLFCSYIRVYEILKANNLHDKKKFVNKEKILQLYEEGYKNVDIVRITGYSKSSVGAIIKENKSKVIKSSILL